jgi:tetrahydromethanopterin S-methyltransferase subunit G
MQQKINHNSQQDIEIAKLHTKVDELKERFDKFVDNEFKHLRDKVDWIVGTVIVGFLVSIVLLLIGIFLR